MNIRSGRWTRALIGERCHHFIVNLAEQAGLSSSSWQSWQVQGISEGLSNRVRSEPNNMFSDQDGMTAGTAAKSRLSNDLHGLSHLEGEVVRRYPGLDYIS